jgi:hypothetical protein
MKNGRLEEIEKLVDSLKLLRPAFVDMTVELMEELIAEVRELNKEVDALNDEIEMCYEDS